MIQRKFSNTRYFTKFATVVVWTLWMSGWLGACRKKTAPEPINKQVDPQAAQRLLEKQRLEKAIAVVKSAKNANGFSIEQTLHHWRLRSLAVAKEKNLPPPGAYEWTGICPSADACRISVSFFDGGVSYRPTATWHVEKNVVKPHNELAMVLMDPKLAQPRPQPRPVVSVIVVSPSRKSSPIKKKRRVYRRRRKPKKKQVEE